MARGARDCVITGVTSTGENLSRSRKLRQMAVECQQHEEPVSGAVVMSRVNTTATQREKHEHQMSVNARALRDIQGSIRRPYLTMEAFFTCPVDMGVPKV